jgi:hypothetical protein
MPYVTPEQIERARLNEIIKATQIVLAQSRTE